MFKELCDATSQGLHNVSKRYDEFCSAISRAANEHPNDPFAICYNYVGKQVRIVKTEVLPQIRKNTPAFITFVAQKAFWIVPALALVTRFYASAYTGLFTGACGLLNTNRDTRKISEDLALVGFAQSAAFIGFHAVQLAVTGNPNSLVSIIFNLFCLVKCGRIVEGRDIAS